MRWFAMVLVLVAACGDNGTSATPWLEDAHILVDGYDQTNTMCRTGPCPHDENTDMTVFGGATYLVHRTANSQILGPNSALRVYKSTDRGEHFDLLAVIPAPVDRDLRDPSFFVVGGQLALKAITRLPVDSTRDSNVGSISIATTSLDAGATWGPLNAIGPETWSFWRVKQVGDTYYSAAYEDGDKQVVLFSSTDGTTWTPGATIYDVSADTPLETELIFQPSGTLVALVRMDGTDDELLGNVGRLRTNICTADPPYASFTCAQTLDGQRLDGPLAFDDAGHQFVIARRNIAGPACKKRTALFELVEDATGVFSLVDHGDFPSAGDTSYAGIAPIDDHRFVVSYYSSNVIVDPNWETGMISASDIWQATIDLDPLE